MASSAADTPLVAQMHKSALWAACALVGPYATRSAKVLASARRGDRNGMYVLATPTAQLLQVQAVIVNYIESAGLARVE